MKKLIKNYYFSLKKPKKIDNIDISQNKTKLDIKERVARRGKIQLIVVNNFQDKYEISSTFIFDIIKYNKEGEIVQIFENNIEQCKYFNVIIFIYDNIDDSFRFLKSFIEYIDENCIVKNCSDYPFFVFFENKNFNKELLYSYYLKNTKEMDISSFYEIKSHNLIFINDSKYDLNNLLMNDITNYFYEYDFKIKYNTYNIEFLFMGETGCGKSTFINYLLGMPRAYTSTTCCFKSRGGVYMHSEYPITITDSKGFEVSDRKQQEKIFKKLEKNLNEELNTSTHIAFYFIRGPYNSNRGFDYSIIGPLLKFEQYHILYYVIMTKDPEETKRFANSSKRFLASLINNRDFYKVMHDFKDIDLLVQALEKVKSNLENRIFSIDSLKKKSQTIDLLLNQIFKDLQVQKNIMKINIKECFQSLKKNAKFSFNISNNEKAK